MLDKVQAVDVRYKYIEITLTPKEEEAYYKAAIGFLGEEYRDFAARIPNLQRVVNGTVDEDGIPLSKTVHNSKIQKLLQIMTDLLSDNKAVIIYTELRDTTRSFKRHYFLYVSDNKLFTITGNTSSA